MGWEEARKKAEAQIAEEKRAKNEAAKNRERQRMSEQLRYSEFTSSVEQFVHILKEHTIITSGVFTPWVKYVDVDKLKRRCEEKRWCRHAYPLGFNDPCPSYVIVTNQGNGYNLSITMNRRGVINWVFKYDPNVSDPDVGGDQIAAGTLAHGDKASEAREGLRRGTQVHTLDDLKTTCAVFLLSHKLPAPKK